MGDIAGLVGLACVPNARNGANVEMTAQICADMDGKNEGIMGQQCCCPIMRNYRMAIGLPGEPVAPLRRSGAKLKANS